jgi:hypothetical protein
MSAAAFFANRPDALQYRYDSKNSPCKNTNEVFGAPHTCSLC